MILCHVYESHSALSDSLQHNRLYRPQNSPGQNTVGSLSLLQGIFPTQRLNPGLLNCRWILYCLRHQGSPRILEWVAYPFCRESSQPKNRTEVSCIAGRFFTNWAIRDTTITRRLLKLMSIESVMLSNHFILCHLLLLLPSIFPSIRVFSNESVLLIRWPKYWSFSFSILILFEPNLRIITRNQRSNC